MRFPPGPVQPRLAVGEAHLWLADLDAVPARAGGALLSRAELTRAHAIVRPRAGLRWAASRAILRLLLAIYTGTPAGSLRFATGPAGKPVLSGRRCGQPAFNLAHSGDLALIALALPGPVGVDIEVARPALGFSELQAWTRREAAAKLDGRGLSLARPAAGRGPVWLGDLELGVGTAGTLALRAEPAQIRSWSWPPTEDARRIAETPPSRLPRRS